jgi:alkylation response protein AidB-like acyl-CoA dehydrogenase
VIRPTAREWDEREETPWPIIEEAARIGLYSFEFVASVSDDPAGLLIPVVMEEMAWGDAGLSLATKTWITNGGIADVHVVVASVGEQAIGVGRAAQEYALGYAMQRKQFGRAIIENQAVAFKLADMRTRIDAARLLTWRAAWMGKTGKPFEAAEGSMSKLHGGETAVWVTEQAIQIPGGAGYVREHPVEPWPRDAKIFTIFEGTSEIQRLLIARAISGVHVR